MKQFEIDQIYHEFSKTMFKFQFELNMTHLSSGFKYTLPKIVKKNIVLHNSMCLKVYCVENFYSVYYLYYLQKW